MLTAVAVYYHRNPPMLFDDDGTPLNSFQPDPQMLEGAR
jgi:hypothetical protein